MRFRKYSYVSDAGNVGHSPCFYEQVMLSCEWSNCADEGWWLFAWRSLRAHEIFLQHLNSNHGAGGVDKGIETHDQHHWICSSYTQHYRSWALKKISLGTLSYTHARTHRYTQGEAYKWNRSLRTTNSLDRVVGLTSVCWIRFPGKRWEKIRSKSSLGFRIPCWSSQANVFGPSSWTAPSGKFSWKLTVDSANGGIENPIQTRITPVKIVRNCHRVVSEYDIWTETKWKNQVYCIPGSFRPVESFPCIDDSMLAQYVSCSPASTKSFRVLLEHDCCSRIRAFQPI